ncbi:hypothetical protein M427DRAFT_152247 [Gonapodya prolifera JEL478]|uniref:Uncharacterized protein n=1 Tax=Gonapodya prolifera (strain JEL478) TaxID=1344416 RepID=A0A139ASP4_GONPJ|nr:hypothetical protein M427DRAFT_152247 [Gonapodya prolifera JEL478]|eukprot:KXS19761.1 hypothetical protein M427DRAFT_152247 [Gonapodya prolifera JEL478]
MDQSSKTRTQKAVSHLSSLTGALVNEPTVGLHRVREHGLRTIPELVRLKDDLVQTSTKLENVASILKDTAQTVDDMRGVSSFKDMANMADRARESLREYEFKAWLES